MELSDRELLTNWCARRNAQAFQAIVQRHASMVFHTAMRILRNASDAEDATQECFRALVAARDADQIRSLGAWLHGTATKLSLMHARSNSRRREREKRYAESVEVVRTPHSHDEMFSIVDEAIQSLEDRYRIPIIAHFLEGKSHVAIAKELRVSRSTVTNHVNEGVRQVEGILKRRGVMRSVVLAPLLTAHVASASPVAPSLASKLGTLALSQGQGVAVHGTAVAPWFMLAKWALAALLITIPVAGIAWMYTGGQERSIVTAGNAPVIEEFVDANAVPDTPAEEMAQAETTPIGYRVIHFPENSSLGVVSVMTQRAMQPYRLGRDNTNFFETERWAEVSAARGDVRVPMNQPVKLTVFAGGLQSLSDLKELKPDDVHTLSFEFGTRTDRQAAISDAELCSRIQHLTELKALELIGIEMTGQGLRYLAGMHELERLEFGAERSFVDRELSHLSGLRSLQVLNLFVPVSDEGLQYLTALPALRELSVKYQNIRGPGLAHLAEIPTLEFLELRGMPYGNQAGGPSNTALRYLANATSLRSLTLFMCTNLTDASVPHLARMTHLEELEFIRQSGYIRITDAAMPALGSMTQLRSLGLGPTLVTDEGLAHLRGLEWLKSIQLPSSQPGRNGRETIGDTTLVHLSHLPRLEKIRAGRGMFTDEGLRHLGGLRRLEELAISSVAPPMSTTDLGPGSIAGLPRLKVLNLHWGGLSNRGVGYLSRLTTLKLLYLQSDARRVTVSGVNSLNSLTNMRELTLYDIVRDDADLDLSGMTELDRIFIDIEHADPKVRASAFRDGDLAWVAGLKNLTYIGLVSAGPYLTDDGLASLANLTQMERLSVGGERLTDRGLAHLAGLKSLYQLVLSEGAFTDAGMRHLERLHGLRYLTIDTSRHISPGAQARLRQSMPDLWALNVR